MPDREFLFAAAAGFGLAVGVGVAYQRKLARERAPTKPLASPPPPAVEAPVAVVAPPPPPAAAAPKPESGGKVRAKALWNKAGMSVMEKFKAKYPEGFGSELILLEHISVDNVFLLPVSRLSAYATPDGKRNRMGIGVHSEDVSSQQDYNKLMDDSDVIIHDIVRKAHTDPVTTAYVRAGPRATLHFDPSKVRAAIVTCGGLCPGLNNIIQGLVRTLKTLYGVESVLGVRGGYQGFGDDPRYAPVPLCVNEVIGFQNEGGTQIGSGRGSFDLDKTIAFLERHGINQLYVVGGDGTHRAANKIANEAKRLRLNIAVCGVPKTIDNDIDLLDRSFGFNTAVEEAQAAILSAKTEAKCNLPNGIGIVKLMGRHSGFIAVHAAICSGDVDLCLVPEVPVVTTGPKGCLPHLQRVLEQKGHAVVVVAEGAGEEILGKNAEVDAGGNRKLPELGTWLKGEIGTYFQKIKMPVTVKYIDPSYMIRSVPANASDAVYCLLLAQNAVHGAMAGYTAFSVGMVNNRLVYIPINSLVKNSPRMMDPMGRTWERVLTVTGQPNTAVKLDPKTSAISTRTTI